MEETVAVSFLQTWDHLGEGIMNELSSLLFHVKNGLMSFQETVFLAFHPYT